MDDVVSIDDFKREAKKREVKEKFRRMFNVTVNWVNNNREFAIMLGSAVIGLATTVIKGASKDRKLKKEENLKELYCYDRSLGHYWELRRKLTNAEWVEIDKRKKNGERLGDILEELKVLK